MYSFIIQCFGRIFKAPNGALICFDEFFHDIQEPSYFFLIPDSDLSSDSKIFSLINSEVAASFSRAWGLGNI